MNNPRDWAWSKDFGCWISRDSNFAFPKAFCLGDRLVYVQGGVDTPASHFRSSTVDHWGGGYWGQDLREALCWLHQAEGTDNYNWCSSGGHLAKQLDLFKHYVKEETA